ncbi:MAG: hypothetical protein JEZ07_19245 [Phycisphaerae bacterium]|nr:hypothetical protein [Phycisphaerae bacterium]
MPPRSCIEPSRLRAPGDQDGYQYTWDYENRIVNIKDSSDNDVVDYTYDALGRRIRKIDMPGHSTLESTTLYWYNNNWQVLAETDETDSLERVFLYGNYIDEVLINQEVANSYQLYYQLQDYLYSSVALLDQNNAVVQRVEYDSYGKPTKLNDNFTTFNGTDPGNPYLFTGRRVDVLDGGDKVLQFSRNRMLDYETGRWLSHDPLGIVPGGHNNAFCVLSQLSDGNNLYSYCSDNSIQFTDPYGLWKWWDCCACGAALIGKFGGAFAGCAIGCKGAGDYGDCVSQCLEEYFSPEELWRAFKGNPAEWIGAGACVSCGVRIVKKLIEEGDPGKNGDTPKGCMPCTPVPKGGLAYDYHKVPPKKLDWPHKGSHTHHFKMNQSPAPVCICGWSRNFIPSTPGFSPLPGAIPVSGAGGGGPAK